MIGEKKKKNGNTLLRAHRLRLYRGDSTNDVSVTMQCSHEVNQRRVSAVLDNGVVMCNLIRLAFDMHLPVQRFVPAAVAQTIMSE